MRRTTKSLRKAPTAPITGASRRRDENARVWAGASTAGAGGAASTPSAASAGAASGASAAGAGGAASDASTAGAGAATTGSGRGCSGKIPAFPRSYATLDVGCAPQAIQ